LLLIGGEGNLLAVFLPKSSERNSRERLPVRFILSRLALPPQTRYVLLFEESLADAVSQRVAQNFAAVLPWDRRRELAKIIKDKDFTRQRNLPAEVAQFARQRFSDVYQVTRALKRRTAQYRLSAEPQVPRRRKPMPPLKREVKPREPLPSPHCLLCAKSRHCVPRSLDLLKGLCRCISRRDDQQNPASEKHSRKKAIFQLAQTIASYANEPGLN
jgi:hypothetical protein